MSSFIMLFVDPVFELSWLRGMWGGESYLAGKRRLDKLSFEYVNINKILVPLSRWKPTDVNVLFQFTSMSFITSIIYCNLLVSVSKNYWRKKEFAARVTLKWTDSINRVHHLFRAFRLFRWRRRSVIKLTKTINRFSWTEWIYKLNSTTYRWVTYFPVTCPPTNFSARYIQNFEHEKYLFLEELLPVETAFLIFSTVLLQLLLPRREYHYHFNQV